MPFHKFRSRKLLIGAFLLMTLFPIFAITLPGWAVAIWLPVILFTFLIVMRKEISQ